MDINVGRRAKYFEKVRLLDKIQNICKCRALSKGGIHIKTTLLSKGSLGILFELDNDASHIVCADTLRR